MGRYCLDLVSLCPLIHGLQARFSSSIYQVVALLRIFSSHNDIFNHSTRYSTCPSSSRSPIPQHGLNLLCDSHPKWPVKQLCRIHDPHKCHFGAHCQSRSGERPEKSTFFRAEQRTQFQEKRRPPSHSCTAHKTASTHKPQNNDAHHRSRPATKCQTNEHGNPRLSRRLPTHQLIRLRGTHQSKLQPSHKHGPAVHRRIHYLGLPSPHPSMATIPGFLHNTKHCHPFPRSLQQ